ncbi:hypothetical protein NIES39_O01560 [Arthrospira platensis NIES-39]|nr:hypothetical protein NIES39_O01560 [Arthrospira platensis NIES-39]
MMKIKSAAKSIPNHKWEVVVSKAIRNGITIKLYSITKTNKHSHKKTSFDSGSKICIYIISPDLLYPGLPNMG